MNLLKTVLTAAFIFNATAAAVADPGACEAEILHAAARHDVPAGILYAVGLAETGRKGSLHPNALNIAGKPVFAHSPAHARAEFEAARAKGVKLIDIGCMQINHHYHANAFNGIEEMLDPARNVDYGARFLAELRGRHDTWAMAVARYHAGPDNDPAQRRYICRVIANLVATGFGQWTAQARAYCT